MEHGDVRYVPAGGQPHASDRREPIMAVDEIVVVLAPLSKARHAACEVLDVGIELGWGEGNGRARGDVNQSYSCGNLLHRGQVGVGASSEDVNVHTAAAKLARQLPYIDVHAARVARASEARQRRGMEARIAHPKPHGRTPPLGPSRRAPWQRCAAPDPHWIGPPLPPGPGNPRPADASFACYLPLVFCQFNASHRIPMTL